uniref:Integrase catalytic domain-containing protein n=1 Tax=Tanacetum cinerariifolium TaxID=118510 RepID=A0A6L2KTV6_TANCI|nr:hypothetical protein [Tanacetum cinerariifolium]
MAAIAQNTNNTTIKLIIQQKKLTGPNFTIWFQNLRIVLRSEGKLAHLEQPMTPLSYPVVSQVERDAYKALNDAQNEIACLMLVSMSLELRRTVENYKSYDMIQELKTMFEEQAKQKLFETVKAFHTCKQEDGQSDYDQFVQNYNMHNMGKMLAELHAMLKLHEKGILNKAKTPAVLAIREGKIQKDKNKLQGIKGKAKGKHKLAYAPKTKIPPSPKRDNLAKDSICYHCKVVGHWRRNCLSYHVVLKKRKNASEASNSGIFTIELYAISNNTWVYDTGYETHICNTSQRLRRSKNLKHRALSLYMGNGMRAAVEAIKSFKLILPSGLIIVLDNCHFAPTVTRGVVSISRLVKNGYIHTFMNYGISISKDNVFYFNAIPCDDVYEIDMHNLYLNVNFIFNISNKRAKHELDSYYLWHCRFGHINKKRLDMLQRDRLLQPTHDESHKKCKSCISGKMARKPFPHQVERAKDLLGLIHTGVCGPSRIVFREDANYFITFTDNFSRYGFVYLIKHKHEMFETFKVFQNEVENQLDKKIKAIRSDRRGEYLSHEFVNHMKSYGIGYALETAAHMLNMVLTKKVNRMPYEIWHGKAPNLSYLRVWGCETLVKRDTPEKLDSRSIKCIFVDSFMVQEVSGSDKGLEIIKEEDTQPSENTGKKHDEVAPIEVEPQNVTVPIRRSTRIHQVPNRYGYYVDVKEYELWDFDEPPNYIAALILVELPPNGRTIGSKWLFKTKADMDGNVHTFKARLVAKVYTQTHGVDYKETFSPVADIRAIRTLLAIVAFNDYEIWQMDVKIAFLNGHLSEDVYMVQSKRKSQGAKTPTETGYVFVLNGGAVDWKSAKQSATAMSSTEAEYIVADEASMEAVWMGKFIDGLGGVVPSNKIPIEMLCDNEPALAIVGDPGIFMGAINFQKKYHYIREVIQRGEIILKKVHTDDNIAGPFTKPMSFNKHFEHAMKIGIVNASSLMKSVMY